MSAMEESVPFSCMEHAAITRLARPQGVISVLQRVQAGVRRARLEKGPATLIHLLITVPILRRIREALDGSSHPHRKVLWAIAAVAFFSFFRLGELLPEKSSENNTALLLTWSDISVDRRDNPRVVSQWIGGTTPGRSAYI